MAKYDLHIHSTFSDGQLTPYEIFRASKDLKLETISITDHNTIKAYEKFKIVAQQKQLDLIPGVEFNAGDHANFHILGYGIKDIDGIENYLIKYKNGNIKPCLETIRLLRINYNIDLPADEIALAYSKNGILDKNCIAKALVNEGHCSSIKEAYDLYIGRDAKAYSPIKKLFSQDVIKLIHAFGGVAVWAHPNIAKIRTENGERFFTDDELAQKVMQLKLVGLDGIECYNNNLPMQMEYLDYLAKENNLLKTGGTDFHSYKTAASLGCEEVSEEDVYKLKQKITKNNHELEQN